VVRNGDTLYKIARKYGTSVAAIKKLNGMKSDRLTVKKRIRVK
jgi:N-acetylmuramoyl-L-alanine amidase